MTELEANEWDLANRKRFILALTAVVTAFMAVLWAFHGTRAVVESRYLYVAFYLPGVVACLLLCCWLTTVLRFRSPRRGRQPSESNRSMRVLCSDLQ